MAALAASTLLIQNPKMEEKKIRCRVRWLQATVSLLLPTYFKIIMVRKANAHVFLFTASNKYTMQASWLELPHIQFRSPWSVAQTGSSQWALAFFKCNFERASIRANWMQAHSCGETLQALLRRKFWLLALSLYAHNIVSLRSVFWCGNSWAESNQRANYADGWTLSAQLVWNP